MKEQSKTPWGIFLVLLVVLEFFCYGISGVFQLSNVSIENLEESICYSFLHLQEAWNGKTPAVLGIGVLIWLLFVSRYLQFHRNYHTQMYGSATFRDVHEACEYYRDKNTNQNRIISQNLEVSLKSGLANNNMIICATSGDFKTTSEVEPNLLRFLSSYIVLDVKGELQRKWGNAFKRAGYKIASLNFQDPTKSDRYNPFVYIEREEDVLRMVRTLFDACRPMKETFSSGDPFWDDAVKLVFQAGISAVWLEGRRNGKVGTMNRMIELFNMESQKVYFEETEEEKSKLQLYMDDLADQFGENYPPVRDYRKLKDGAPDTVRSVFLMVYSMLAICDTAEVKRIFEDNDINIREIGLGVNGNPDKKTILFLELPPLSNAYDWIISMFYTQCFDILERTSDLEVGGALPVRVEFWMDEFYTGPKPLDVPRLLGIVRGWNISMVMILQDFAQLEDLYKGKKFEIVLNNVAVIVFLGSGPLVTSGQELISKTIGKGTFDIQNDNMHFGNNANSGINWSQQGRELMLPDEVKNMSPTQLLVFIKSSKPIIDTKAIPFDYPAYGYTAPKWLKKPYSELLSLGNYTHPVYTIYDEEHFHYVTIEREPIQIVTDEKDISALQEAAKKDPKIYTYNVAQEELLYLSWGEPEYTADDMEMMFQQAMEDVKFKEESLKGLIVLQNTDGSSVPNFGGVGIKENIDKTEWRECATFKDLLAAHWKDLSILEQEEISIAIEDGFSEEQLYELMLSPSEDMAKLHRIFRAERQMQE